MLIPFGPRPCHSGSQGEADPLLVAGLGVHGYRLNLAGSDHLVLPERGLRRPAQLLSGLGPLRHTPQANAVVGVGDAGQSLPEPLQLMGLEASFENAQLQPFAIAFQQLGQLAAPLGVRAVIGHHPQLLRIHRRRGTQSVRSGSSTAAAKFFTS